MALRLDMSSDPPAIRGTTWSTSVAGAPQPWHVQWSRRMTRSRRRLHSQRFVSISERPPFIVGFRRVPMRGERFRGGGIL